MFKHIIFIFFMALCLLSCSSSGQDDPFIPEPQQVGISFGGNSGSWQDASSRAGEGETGLESLFSSFKVWGYKTKNIDGDSNENGGSNNDGSTNSSTQKVMDGYRVDWNTSSKDWEYIGTYNASLNLYQTIKYWDYSALQYHFWAYAPATAHDVTASENTNTNSHSITIPYEFNSNATLTSTPYISNLCTPKIGDQVKLTFVPLIAKVRFKFKYNDKQIASITEISFRDERWKSTVNGNHFLWSGSAVDKTPVAGNIIATYPLSGTSMDVSKTWETTNRGILELTIPYEEEKDENHQTEIRRKWYFMPPMDIAHYQQGNYILSANIEGNQVSATVGSEYMQWKAGFQYTYIFKVSETTSSITFAEVEVEQWNKNSNIDNNGTGTGDW
jgi:hypothetical protein